MKVYVDIDETICFYSGTREYHLAEPSYINISKINDMYNKGHEIVYWTARGTVHTNRRDEYYALTEKQLSDWGCKYHKLLVGEKPAYDLLICDKTKRIEEL